MNNVCNPDDRFYISDECVFRCYYDLIRMEMSVEKKKCYSDISRRSVKSANYNDISFTNTTKFAWAMGLLNVIVLLAFICWFNIPNYMLIIERTKKSELTGFKYRLLVFWDWVNCY